jgi:hypothetical protein
VVGVYEMLVPLAVAVPCDAVPETATLVGVPPLRLRVIAVAEAPPLLYAPVCDEFEATGAFPTVTL